MTNKNYPAEVLELSHSTLGNFDSCARKLEFSKLFSYNLYTRNRTSSGGLALHAATGEYVINKDRNAAIYKLLLEYPIDLCDNPVWSWSLEACYAALLSIFQFFDKHPELELAKISDVPAVEVPFLINIKHNCKDLMPVVYRGYIDFIFYNRMDNSYFVLDLKTTGVNVKDFSPLYYWDSQCLPYGLVLNHVLKKDITNLEVKYLIAKVDVLNPFTQLLTFEKTQEDMRDWARDMYIKINTINSYIKTKWFPRNSKGCMAFNRKCKYFSLCESRNLETINLMLSTMDREDKKPFNPLITMDLELS